ncbi:hypothetical protein [Clostridium perfringens]|uniref:Uncharacterized protein n=1 Tax=Clostridium perfringens TaxID=1502 RepID=A0A140GRZ4_CLOPF|nr:hypothetical protein [Clostridium perfringens]AMN31303.1 hypothetical protein JFP838_pA0387 [Clostridium perfringens]
MNFKFEYDLGDFFINAEYLSFLKNYFNDSEKEFKNFNWIIYVGNFKFSFRSNKTFIFDENLKNSGKILVVCDNIHDLNVLYNIIVSYFMKEK